MSDGPIVQWVRFDLVFGGERNVTEEQVRDVCNGIGITYEDVLAAGGVRYGRFSYEPADVDDEPEPKP